LVFIGVGKKAVTILSIKAIEKCDLYASGGSYHSPNPACKSDRGITCE
jgi:hypothetical protein